ncbi:MAG TPA: adenine deaminase C-terminal domain-containing protein [Spirochaetia bacterium]|nr:adenine deaminase C-terminal domain-containing protein [Spirochaetia bacterium]
MDTASIAEKKLLVRVALGEESADTVLLGGVVVNVHTLETYPADIAIKNGRVVFVGDVSHTVGAKTVTVDMNGRYLVPGFIETHMHVGGSQLNMTEFGKLALSHGTTSIATDMYEIGIIRGMKGIRYFLEELRATGIKPLFLVPMPAYHQDEAFGNIGTFTEKDAMEVLNWQDCYGLNEVNLAKIADKDPGVERLVEEAQRLGKTLVGHAAATSGKRLQAALNFMALTGDHECVTWEDANEKARLGMCIQLRDGSVGSDIHRIISERPSELNTIGDFAYSSDEIAPDRMEILGHLDAKIRMSIEAGAAPLLAIRGATLNAARMFRLDHEIGSLSPGKWADIVVIDDLRSVKVRDVVVNGEFLVRDGSYVRTLPQRRYPEFLVNTVHLRTLSPESFQVKAPRRGTLRIRLIRARDGSLFSESLTTDIEPQNGRVEADQDRDILKVVQLDRHQRSGRIGIGFLTGFGLKNGAIASTFNPCSENLSVLGTNDADMILAANYLIEKGGGFVVASQGRVVRALDLPIAGIASEKAYREVVERLSEIHAEIDRMGCTIRNPFHILAFMVFPAHFGALKVCSHGLVDVEHGRIVSLFADETRE